MIVGVGDVKDPDLIMGELKKGLAAETKLTLDRPRRIPASWVGNHRCWSDPVVEQAQGQKLVVSCRFL